MKLTEFVMKTLIFVCMTFIISSCASVTSKKMNSLNLGMTKASVLEILGNPTSTQAMGDLTVLKYSDFWSCTKPMGKGCDYFVYFRNGLVVQYGAAEDFLSSQERIANQQYETALQSNALMNFSNQMQQSENQKRQQELAQARIVSSHSNSTNCTTTYVGNTAYTNCT